MTILKHVLPVPAWHRTVSLRTPSLPPAYRCRVRLQLQVTNNLHTVYRSLRFLTAVPGRTGRRRLLGTVISPF